MTLALMVTGCGLNVMLSPLPCASPALDGRSSPLISFFCDDIITDDLKQSNRPITNNPVVGLYRNFKNGNI